MNRRQLLFIIIGSLIVVTVGSGIGVSQSQETGGCLYVWTNDGDGEEVYATVGVIGTDNDYAKFYETDESGASDACGPVSDNGVPFHTPGGEFNVYVIDEGQHNEYWGVHQVSVSDSGEEYVSYDRGGIYQVEGDLQSSRDTRRFEPDESATLEARLYNGQRSGSNEVTTEVYVYPEGEDRPDRPTETLQSKRIDAKRHGSITGGISMPHEEGTYEVDVMYETTYDLSSSYTQLSDYVDLGTVSVESFDPPRIIDNSPDGAAVIGASGSQEFSIDVSDTDTPLSEIERTWYVDGTRQSQGSSFRFTGDNFGAGEHTVEVRVSDGMSYTEDARQRWTVDVLMPPEIESADPSQDTVTISSTQSGRFSVYPRDPDTDTYDLQIQWYMDGSEIARGEEFVVDGKRVSAGTHQLRAVVSDGDSETTNAVNQWAVEIVSPPDITSVDPTPEGLSIGASDSQEFSVEVSDADTFLSDIERTWYVDGMRESQGAAFQFTGNEFGSGEHTVEVRVSDGTAQTEDTAHRWTVDVLMPPEIESANPSQNSVTVSVNQSAQFGVFPADTDTGSSGLQTQWYMDGSQVAQGEEFVIERQWFSVGSHQLRAVVSDGDSETTDAVKQWDVEIVSPPEIVSRMPEQSALTLGPSTQQNFEVDIRDPDTLDSGLQYTWMLDGEQISRGSTLTLDTSQYEPASHQLSVTISDNTDITKDDTIGWTVDILDRPSIEDISYEVEDNTVHPGEQVDFHVEAVEPNGLDITDYVWEIRGERIESQSPSYVFEEPGDVTARVTVTNSRGISVNESIEFRVASAPPKITNIEPQSETLIAGNSTSFEVSVEDPVGRNTAFDYTWYLNGEVISNSRTHSREFSQVGSHQARVVVTNEFGANVSRELSVTVRNDQPTIQLLEPASTDVRHPSLRTVQFRATVADEDKTNVNLTIRVDGEQNESRQIGRNAETVSFSHTFSSPGDHTVTFTAEDGNGGSSEVQWDLDVTSRPPEFGTHTPSESDLSILSGESVNFSAQAVDPEEKGISYQWLINGSYVGSGPKLNHTFGHHGEYDIRVVATDPQGISTNWTWSADVNSFKAPIGTDLANAISRERIESLSTPVRLSLSGNNPSVNERSVKIEFVMEIPNGVELQGTSEVSSASGAQVVSAGVIEPGTQEPMGVRIAVVDESRRGDIVEVPYLIRYNPSGQPNDYEVITNRTLYLEVTEPKTPTETPTENSSPGDDFTDQGEALTNESGPGFNIVHPFAAIILLLLYRRRHIGEVSE